jgi:hypothetical protein
LRRTGQQRLNVLVVRELTCLLACKLLCHMCKNTGDLERDDRIAAGEGRAMRTSISEELIRRHSLSIVIPRLVAVSRNCVGTIVVPISGGNGVRQTARRAVSDRDSCPDF